MKRKRAKEGKNGDSFKRFSKENNFSLVLLFQPRWSYQGNSRMNKLPKNKLERAIRLFLCALSCSSLLEDGGF